MATLHTNTTVDTVDRLIEQFPSAQQQQIRTMLADALIGVVAQMLCKKISGGRKAAYEVLLVNTAVSNLIREGKTFQIPSIMQVGKKEGMKLMNESFLEMVKSGEVEVNEVILKTTEPETLKQMLSQAGLI